MKHDSLSDLISALEYGTKLHISVVFLSNFGNVKTRLPFQQGFHTSPICRAEKATAEGYAACYRCRNLALKMAVRRKKSFGGCCVKGIYEYCRPVIHEDEVACVIFVGNIRGDDPAKNARLQEKHGGDVLQTLEPDFSPERCQKTADIVESYILHLLSAYAGSEFAAFDPLLENIKSHLAENMRFGFSMQELAEVFNYNEKYIGRYFKSKTGMTVREYCNQMKIDRAKKLLRDTDLSIATVATRIGYNNVTYFNRVFHLETGMSPKEFRRATR